MAPRSFTAEELIALIRKNTGFTDVLAEGTTDDDLLKYVNEEIVGLHSKLISWNEENFVYNSYWPMVPGQSKYRIPNCCMYEKLRNVWIVDSYGTPYSISQISRENVPSYNQSLGILPVGYYLEAHHIVLVPAPQDSGGKLWFSFYNRPGELVKSTDCRRVKAVDLATGYVTIDSAKPSSWVASSGQFDQVLYDFHDSFSGAAIKAWGVTMTSVDTTTHLLFDKSAIDGSRSDRFPVEVGDWVCQAETAALPGIPREMHPLIAMAVVLRLKQFRDPDGYLLAKAEYDRMLGLAEEAAEPRVDGAGQQISLLGSTYLGR